MSEIIQFPVANKRQTSDNDDIIEQELMSIAKRDRAKLRFELIKTIDSYDDFFTEWTLTIPKDSDETFKKQIYDIAHGEHERKMRMLKDIMKLKIKVLVAEYSQKYGG